MLNLPTTPASAGHNLLQTFLSLTEKPIHEHTNSNQFLLLTEQALNVESESEIRVKDDDALPLPILETPKLDLAPSPFQVMPESSKQNFLGLDSPKQRLSALDSPRQGLLDTTRLGELESPPRVLETNLVSTKRIHRVISLPTESVLLSGERQCLQQLQKKLDVWQDIKNKQSTLDQLVVLLAWADQLHPDQTILHAFLDHLSYYQKQNQVLTEIIHVQKKSLLE